MRDDVAGPDGSELSEWLGPDRLESTVNDDEFNTLCEAHSFGAVARGEFPLMPRGLLKALVDAAVAAERERLARDVAGLHMAQSVNNQNYPSAWHDGVDAALAVIRGA